MKKYIIFFIISLFSIYSFSQDNIKHVVQSGESLSKLSEQYNVPVEDIKEFNGLENDIIFINQIIMIPSKKFYKPKINYNDINIDKRYGIKIVYDSQIGVRELTGNNDGYHVEKYINSTGLDGNYPWCAAFVYWVFKQNNIEINLKYPAWVPSYFPDDKLIYVRDGLKNREPIMGDLIGIWFNSKKRLAHIGFYDGENDKYYFTVEGNTNEAGVREGDGVYRKRRIKRQVHSISSWVENDKNKISNFKFK